MGRILFLLLCGHALGDFSLQTSWMAASKVRGGSPVWFHVLTAHSLIHGLTAYLATGILAIGLAETAAHWVVDYGKGSGWYGFQADQLIHVSFRLIWAILAVFVF